MHSNGCVCSKGSVCSRRAGIECVPVASAVAPGLYLADRCSLLCVVTGVREKGCVILGVCVVKGACVVRGLT